MECFYDGTTYLSCGANLRIEAPGLPQNNVLVAISALFLSLSFHLSQYQQGGAINPILVWRTMNGTVWELLRAIEDGEDFNRLIANDINSETLRTNLWAIRDFFEIPNISLPLILANQTSFFFVHLEDFQSLEFYYDYQIHFLVETRGDLVLEEESEPTHIKLFSFVITFLFVLFNL